MSPGEPAYQLTADAVLREVDDLATVEHALCVDDLVLSYVLGRLRLPGPATSVNEAAQAAFGAATRAMKHLQRVNRVLTTAGRPPQVGRSSRLTIPGGTSLPLGAVTDDLEHVIERGQRIAAAVDARYHALEAVLDPQADVLHGDVFDVAASELPGCTDHAALFAAVATPLVGLAPAEYLVVTRPEPDGPLERALLALSRRHYQLVVEMVGAGFAHDEALGGQLIGRATTLMFALDELNAELVNRGLLPDFAVPR